MNNDIGYKLLTLLTLIFLGSYTLYGYAQQQKLHFAVANIQLDQFDTAAQYGDYAKVDGSGNNYAIIKVTSNNPNDDLTGFNFNFGNLKSLVELHDNALWVYVQKNAKTVTISRPGYITLSKVDLGLTVDAGRVYNMQLTFDRIQQTVVYDVNMQMVLFKTEPAIKGATVMIKSQKQGAMEELIGVTDENGTVSKALAYGKYTYKVMSEGNLYHIKEDMMTLNNSDETHTEVVRLQPNFAEITLNAVEGAEIYINNERKGHSLWKGVLISGDYIVTTKKPSHRDSQQRITVREGQNETFELGTPTPITGALSVSTSPTGALITIDGKYYGTSPRIIKDVLIGSHELTLSLANHKTESLHVTVFEGKTENIEATLGTIAKMTITSNPPRAELYINDKYVGYTPYKKEMASGDYDIEMRYKRYKTFKERVHLDSSNPTMDIKMSRQYQLKNQLYIQPMAQVGGLTSAGAAMGCFVSNVNVEVGYVYGFSKETIYWNSVSEDNPGKPVRDSLYPQNLSGKLGYGIVVGSRLRVTPQIGGGLMLVSGHHSDSYAVNATLGARLDYSVVNHISIVAAPEYGFCIKESDTFNVVTNISSKVSGWHKGFKFSIGLSLFL